MASSSRRTFSSALSSCIRTVARTHTNALEHEQEQSMCDLRKAYLAVFAEQNMQHSEDPLWWRGELELCGKEILEEHCKSQETHSKVPPPIDSRTISINYLGEEHIFHAEKNRIIAVGRQRGCDVRLMDASMQSSRLHFLLFLLPERNQLLAIDVGNNTGLYTAAQGGLDACRFKHSTCVRRRVLEFAFDESVVLHCVPKTSQEDSNIAPEFAIGCNVKTCVVCLGRPREVVFPQCRHNVCCEPCASRLQGVCTQCRAVKEEGTHFKPFVGSNSYASKSVVATTNKKRKAQV